MSSPGSPLPSGRYIIQKYYADSRQLAEGDLILARGADFTKRKVVMMRPPFAPVPWKLEHKGGDTYSMVLEDGFAAKIGDDNLLYTTTDAELSHEWELRPVLVKGPEVYYIRSTSAKQAWVITEDAPGLEQQVALEDLGDIVLPEGPSDKFLFMITSTLQDTSQ